MIACITVNFGTSKLIAKYHDGLPNLYIVDNFKSTLERSEIQALAAKLQAHFTPLDSNIGFGRAVNIAVSEAFSNGFTHFLLVNPDLKISRDAVQKIDDQLEAQPNTMLSPLILRPDGKTWFEGAELLKWRGMARHAHVDPTLNTQWLSGACLAFNIKQWETLNGFSDNFFLYWEDVDFTWRWKNRGGELKILSNITAVHEVGGSQETDGKSLLYTYFIARNRGIFSRNNLKRVDRFRWMICTPLFVFSLVKNANHANWKIRLLHTGSAIRGIFGLKVK